MGYASLADCVADLENHGDLIRIDVPLDPCLEIAYIQRRAFQARSPALLFTRPKGCRFPMLANLFGTRERVNYIFRDGLQTVKDIFAAKADFRTILDRPASLCRIFSGLAHVRPKHIAPDKAPVLARTCVKADLPHLVSWPGDGGSFITLPLVYSEDPEKPGAGNLGMYRAQLTGNDYSENEVGLHYQLQRGLGIHHASALNMGRDLPVNINVGGPPSLTVAAIMPLPEGMNELLFAGLLGARRVRLTGTPLPVLADADFALKGSLGRDLKPEGPFGDHLGYYSLRHDFPVFRIESIHHRENAIWPFTSVGRPPQEDTVFGDLIHELTAPLVSQIFAGIKEIHAVDAAGVHPLLLALGSERYTAYDATRKPRELLTLAMHLLGTTQTALAKYVIITAADDAPGLSARDVPAFLMHILERTDLSRDLHFITQCSCDTLDYSGYGLHEGSRLIWAATGPIRRGLGRELSCLPALPSGFSSPSLVLPGVLAISGPKHEGGRDSRDESLQSLCHCFEHWPERENFPLVVVVDDAAFCAASVENFLWTAFTRSDPARDTYGAFAGSKARHWGCKAPLVLDCRLKSFQAPPLEDDPALVEYIEMLAAAGGPLAGIFD